MSNRGVEDGAERPTGVEKEKEVAFVRLRGALTELTGVGIKAGGNFQALAGAQKAIGSICKALDLGATAEELRGIITPYATQGYFKDAQAEVSNKAGSGAK